MRGEKWDQYGVNEKIVELNETEEIVHSPEADRWSEWDMWGLAYYKLLMMTQFMLPPYRCLSI